MSFQRGEDGFPVWNDGRWVLIDQRKTSLDPWLHKRRMSLFPNDVPKGHYQLQVSDAANVQLGRMSGIVPGPSPLGTTCLSDCLDCCPVADRVPSCGGTRSRLALEWVREIRESLR